MTSRSCQKAETGCSEAKRLTITMRLGVQPE